jgi:two-component system, chemotaxis family, CheB/CheR fusion protein
LVIRDITDRTLRLLQDQFLALAAHELRSPLTAVLGSVELLVRRVRNGMEPARLGEPAAMALDAARSLKRLIDDLVDVGRLTSGKLRIVAEPIDLTVVVRDVVEMMQGSAGESPLHLEAIDDSLVVRGDATRLRQVMINLLTNAFTHAPGSPVTVRTRRADNWAEIGVTDRGPGIAPEALPHLFQRFYQATNSDPQQATGMGLGLYIAHEIVEALGGDIAVDSVVGEGATFTIRLPLLEDPTPDRSRHSDVLIA